MSMSKLSEDSAKALGDALNSSPVGKMFGMHKRPDPRPASEDSAKVLRDAINSINYAAHDEQAIKLLKEKDAEIEALLARVREMRTDAPSGGADLSSLKMLSWQHVFGLGGGDRS